MVVTRRLLAAQVTLLVLAVMAALTVGGAPEGRSLLPWHPIESPDGFLSGQRTLPQGVTYAEAFNAARAQALQLENRTLDADPDLAAATWELAGPSNIGGRVTDVAVDPTQPDTVFAAAASGGVWMSTDAGDTFTSIWPDDHLQGMGALAISPDGTLYAGTGETNPGGGSIVFGGDGVYRTSDRGRTWEHLGLETSGAIGRIVVDATDPATIFVAASGDLYNDGGERGVYRSTDGGQTWEQVLAGENATTGASDLSISPDGQTVFATMWDHQRRPEARRYGGPGSGLFRSTDGGDTWTEVTPAPSGSNGLGRIGVAVAPGLPNVVYSIVITRDGPFEGFYKSLDGGTTWVETSLLGDPAGLYFSQSTFGWWFGRVFVDPLDPNHVFVPGVSLTSSLDGGLTFTPHVGPHADQHAMAWDPNLPTRVYLGNDGGVYRSDNRGLVNAGWTAATYQPWMQSYTIDVSQQDPSRMTAGMQDNGCLRSWTGNWNSYCGGDGEMTLINPQNHDNIFGCSQYGNCRRSVNGGDSTSSIGSTASTRRNWTTPLAFDPNDPNTVYYAGNVVNRSDTNGAGGWRAISGDLSKGPGSDPAGYPFGTAFTISVSATQPDTLWVGYDDGSVWKTDDQVNWEPVDVDPTVEDVWVSRVVIDPTDADHVYVTYTGFRQGIDKALVFETFDGGATFRDLSGDLPAAPVNDLLLIDDEVVVASDVGVFLLDDVTVADDGEVMAAWLAVGSGLPKAPVLDIAFSQDSRTLVAGTFGRSLWRVTLPD